MKRFLFGLFALAFVSPALANVAPSDLQPSFFSPPTHSIIERPETPLSPTRDIRVAQGSPCQWTYSFINGQATATYCGDVKFNGSFSGNVNAPNVLYTVSATGAQQQTLQSWLDTHIIATSFPGVDPTGSTNSDMGMAAFKTACLSAKYMDCGIPAGLYKFAASYTWDFSANVAQGLYLHGAGQNATKLQFATGAQFIVTGGTANGVFYATFQNFGVTGNVSAGGAMQLAKPDFSDVLNGFSFRDMWITNSANVAGSYGLAIYQVFSSEFNNITTGDGCVVDANGSCSTSTGGDSLFINGAAFSHFQGSFSAATNGIHIGGTRNTYGLVFTTVDLEVNWNDLTIDNPNAISNLWEGGQFSYCNGAINGQAGTLNQFQSPNFSPRGTAGCTGGGNYVGTNGISLGVQSGVGGATNGVMAQGGALASASYIFNTNIPYTDLDRLSTAQSIAGVKTFTAPPIMAGVVNGTSAAAGNVGEILTATVASASPGTSGSPSNLASLVLTPGVWEVSAGALSNGTTSFTIGTQVLVLSLTSATATPFSNLVGSAENLGIASAYAYKQNVGADYLNVTVSTTVYLVENFTFSGTPTFNVTIKALRIR